MSKLKIALLCNNKMAGPAMMRLAAEGVLCGIATADNDREVVQLFGSQARELGVPYCCATRAGYKEQLAQWLRDTGADAVFVMTFPWRLPAALLAVPRLGFLNFHYGLLPEMRGADPIFESIRQRMPTAGVTVHVMDAGLDTGPIVLREEMPLSADYSYGMLGGQLARMGEELCGKLASPRPSPGERVRSNEFGGSGAGGVTYSGERGAESGNEVAEMSAAPAPHRTSHSALRTQTEWNGWPVTVQDEAKAKYWPKVGEAEVTIRWDVMDSGAIMALVRACNPVAKGVPATINGWKIGICDTSMVNLQGATDAIAPGTIVCLDVQNGLIVYCKDGVGVKLDVVYTAEGVFPGYKLGYFGITMGMGFTSLPPEGGVL